MKTSVPNVIGGHLYLEREGAVLLGQRHPCTAFAPSTWHLLAGHCEFEAVHTCVSREGAEEAGLRIDEQDLRLVHTVHLLDVGSKQPRLQMFFAATRWEGEPELREPDRCTEWRWWPLNSLPDQLVEYTRAALEGITQGSAYT
ncbi:NUDIX hydrolase [Streptomyces sp. NPDC055287]